MLSRPMFFELFIRDSPFMSKGYDQAILDLDPGAVVIVSLC